jgi:hypothetical protein
VPDLEARANARLDELQLACVAHGYYVTPDGRVREEVAAELLGLAAGTLRNWSYGDSPIPFTSVARRRTYRLSDIAAFMEAK